jgi:hypothetical protein
MLDALRAQLVSRIRGGSMGPGKFTPEPGRRALSPSAECWACGYMLSTHADDGMCPDQREIEEVPR